MWELIGFFYQRSESLLHALLVDEVFELVWPVLLDPHQLFKRHQESPRRPTRTRLMRRLISRYISSDVLRRLRRQCPPPRLCLLAEKTRCRPESTLSTTRLLSCQISSVPSSFACPRLCSLRS